METGQSRTTPSTVPARDWSKLIFLQVAQTAHRLFSQCFILCKSRSCTTYGLVLPLRDAPGPFFEFTHINAPPSFKNIKRAFDVSEDIGNPV